MNRAKFWLVLALTLLASRSAQAQLKKCDPVDLKTLTLENQFEGLQSVNMYRGQILVIAYGDRKSADANKYLGVQLQLTFHPTAKGLSPAKARKEPVIPVPDAPPGVASPDVVMVPAASMGTVPALMRPLIRSQVLSASPEMPVWLDWKDDLKNKFGLAAGVPNLIVIDTEGRLRYSFSGEIDQDKFNELTQTIESLRREAVRK